MGNALQSSRQRQCYVALVIAVHLDCRLPLDLSYSFGRLKASTSAIILAGKFNVSRRTLFRNLKEQRDRESAGSLDAAE